MALDSNSRYRSSAGSNSRGGSDIVAIRKPMVSSPYTVYVTKDGDSFDRIAARVFGDSTQYWRIADLNPQIAFPDFIPTNSYIRVPR